MGTIFVDNLEPQSGTSLTLGASGDTVQVASGVTNNLGISMADMWRLNTTFQNVGNSATLLSSNLEQVDTGSFGGIGTGMSESSGTFTFPQTGIYLIIFQVQGRADGGARTSIGGRIKVSTNGGTSYQTRTHGYSSGYANVANASSTLLHMIDVTSTTNIKVQFFVQSNDTTYFDAETGASYNSMTFIRLGDT